MKALRGILTFLTILAGFVTINLTIHGLNPHFHRWLPEGVQQFMTDHDGLKWVAAGVLVVSVLLNLAVEQAQKRQVRAQ
jgi:hypothetical protein